MNNKCQGEIFEKGRNLTSWHKLHDEGHGISHYVCFLHWVCYNLHATLKFKSIFYIRLANVGMLRHEEQSHARATHSSEEAAVADKTLRKWSFQQTATASQELWLHLSQFPSFLLLSSTKSYEHLGYVYIFRVDVAVKWTISISCK